MIPAVLDAPSIPTQGFDPAQYPRTYRVSTKNRIFLIFVGAVNAVMGLLGMFCFVTGQETDGPGERVAFGILGALVLCIGLYVVAYTLKTRLTLYPDRAVLHIVKAVRSLRREEIAGWRVVRLKYYSSLVLRP